MDPFAQLMGMNFSGGGMAPLGGNLSTTEPDAAAFGRQFFNADRLAQMNAHGRDRNWKPDDSNWFSRVGENLGKLPTDPMFMLGLQMLLNKGNLAPGAVQNVLLMQRDKDRNARIARAEKLAAEQEALRKDAAEDQQFAIEKRLSQLRAANVPETAARAIVQQEVATLGEPAPVDAPSKSFPEAAGFWEDPKPQTAKDRIDAMHDEALGEAPARSFPEAAGFWDEGPATPPTPVPPNAEVHQFAPSTITGAAPPAPAAPMVAPAPATAPPSAAPGVGGARSSLNPNQLLQLEMASALMGGTADQAATGSAIANSALSAKRQLFEDAAGYTRDAITGERVAPDVQLPRAPVLPFAEKGETERLMNRAFLGNVPEGWESLPPEAQKAIATAYGAVAGRAKLRQSGVRTLPDGSTIENKLETQYLDNANRALKSGNFGALMQMARLSQDPTAPGGRSGGRGSGGGGAVSKAGSDPWGRPLTPARKIPKDLSTEESKRAGFALNAAARMGDMQTRARALQGIQALSDAIPVKDVLGARLGRDFSSFAVSREYRRFDESMTRTMTDLVYALSGAQATDKEVAQNIKPYMPAAGDTFGDVLKKQRNLADYLYNHMRAVIPARIMQHEVQGRDFREAALRIRAIRDSIDGVLGEGSSKSARGGGRSRGDALAGKYNR